jgi:hypothetical protein
MEFQAWPKTPRLYKDCVVTEKIDGTNACIVVGRQPEERSADRSVFHALPIYADGEYTGEVYLVGAQSRNRLLKIEQDNAGFGKWVRQNAAALVEVLGEGYHYGEWWGSGIQRGYGLEKGDKRFSLFNTHRWADIESAGIPGLTVVPQLYIGPFSTEAIDKAFRKLAMTGSQAAPGYMDPEGVVVYHTASKQVYKLTYENDGGKWMAEAA